MISELSELSGKLGLFNFRQQTLADINDANTTTPGFYAISQTTKNKPSTMPAFGTFLLIRRGEQNVGLALTWSSAVEGKFKLYAYTAGHFALLAESNSVVT